MVHWIIGVETGKQRGLKNSAGNYESYTTISQNSHLEIDWSVTNLPTTFNVLQHKPPTLEIYSDASDVGWGVWVNGNTAGGMVKWQHKCFAINKRNISIKLNIDNTTVVVILKHMGTSHHILDGYSIINTWNWCKNREIWLLSLNIHLPRWFVR